MNNSTVPRVSEKLAISFLTKVHFENFTCEVLQHVVALAMLLLSVCSVIVSMVSRHSVVFAGLQVLGGDHDQMLELLGVFPIFL